MIPEDRPSISTFEVLADQLQIILKGILEEDRNDFDNSATLKAKYFYQSCMDMESIVNISDLPLRTVIDGLGGWPVTVGPQWRPRVNLESVLGLLKRNFTLGALVEEWVGPDDRNSDVHIIQIDQMQLGLPSRDYFLHSESQEALQAYHAYMTDVAVLLGANQSQAFHELWDVVQFERQLANISVPEEDRLDTGAIYSQLSLDDMKRIVPQFDWFEYFGIVLRDVPFNGTERVVSYSTPYFVKLGKLLETTDKRYVRTLLLFLCTYLMRTDVTRLIIAFPFISRVVHNYVLWRLVMDLMPHMPPQYEKTRAEFRKILLGVLTDRNRWNRCVEWTNKKMGMAVGALFIRDNFNHESKVGGCQINACILHLIYLSQVHYEVISACA